VKKYLLATAAVAAAIALPAVASAQATGYIDGSYTRIETPFGDGDGVTVGGGVLLTPDAPVQVQLNGAFTSAEDANAAAVAAHVFHRTETWAAGGFVGYTDAEGVDGILNYGVEGSWYFPAVTLSGSASKLDNDDLGLDATVLAAGIKFFPTDNFSVGGSFGNVDIDGVGDFDVFGAEAEFKFNGPASVFASYDTADDLDVDIWSIGLRWNFGQDSLKSRDRSGASMGSSSAARFLF